MAVFVAVALRGQPRDHVVAAPRHHRQHQDVLLVGLVGQPHNHVIGLHRADLAAVVFGRKSPHVLAVVEHLRVGHVVSGVDIGLDQEHVLRIADMLAQIRRHRGQRLEQRGKDPLPGLDHGILGIGHIQARFGRCRRPLTALTALRM